jgi:hypothetical protein
VESVYSAVRTEYIKQIRFVFKGLIITTNLSARIVKLSIPESQTISRMHYCCAHPNALYVR